VNNIEKVEWQAVSELNQTMRNDGGFGHTGKL
jgi:dUTPase